MGLGKFIDGAWRLVHNGCFTAWNRKRRRASLLVGTQISAKWLFHYLEETVKVDMSIDRHGDQCMNGYLTTLVKTPKGSKFIGWHGDQSKNGCLTA